MKYNVILGFLLLLLVGCGETDLYTNLQEKEANEMIAILLQKGISATKKAGTENTWNVYSDRTQFALAVDVLKDRGYPKDRFASIGEVFQKSGLVSSPLEERVRFMYALSENLSKTLTLISGVVTARVHIVLPEADPYSEKITPSSAAVFITHLPDADIEESVREIKYLVTNSIEGLDYEKVTVALFPTTLSSAETVVSNREALTNILGIRVAHASVGLLWILFGLAAIILAGSMGAAAFFYWKYNQTKSK